MSPDQEPNLTTSAARADAVAALLRLREAGMRVLATIADSQPLAPHHLLALQAVTDGARSLSEVADATNRHVSSVSRVIDHLVGEELLERASHPDDRRQLLLAPTERGRQLVGRFEALDRSMATRMVSAFDADDAHRLASYLDRLAAAATGVAEELEDDPDALADLG